MARYHILWPIVVLAVGGALASASAIISDVNNMLRDATPASPLKTTAAAAAAESTQQQQQQQQQQLRHHLNQDENNVAEKTATSSVELLRFVNDDDDDDVDEDAVNENDNDNDNDNEELLRLDNGNGDANGRYSKDDLALNDQVRLLTKQLNALMMRRREDYEMLEHNLRKSLRLTTDAASVDADMRTELEQLRTEVQALRDAQSVGNKERLTVEWLQQSISEIRKQLAELQHTAGNANNKNTQWHGSAGYEDLATIRSDFEQIKLELAAQRERQQQTEVFVQELREELLQQEEDYKRLLASYNKPNEQTSSASIEETSGSDSQQVELADHRRRHCRFQQQQIHALQLAHRSLRRQVNELKYHRIDERVRNLELEQHRIANANFNLSRQIATLDKLHTSMLELLEDVEGLQTKMDKNIPELRHEISKLEFANAQISSEQNLVREEGKNAARSLQAMAVSVSALQDEREGVKQLVTEVQQLQSNVDRMQSLLNSELHNKLSHFNKPHKRLHQTAPPASSLGGAADGTAATRSDGEIALAETLVAELEHVEAQYEEIINKLPQDCSEVGTHIEGLHLIAPAGQHHPLMTHCSADGWTTVQRRYDGSADFNRSWADYAQGFGMPGGEFWIGNEQLHHLTLSNCTQLRVLMQDIYDNSWLADYGYFYISSRADGYRLHIGEYSGNASDALNYQQGMQFSAIDDDRDISQTHCAANYEGGWWFSHCQHANLNGRYNLGLTWFDASRNEWIAVKSSQMLVKRRSTTECTAPLTINSGTTATPISSTDSNTVVQITRA